MAKLGYINGTELKGESDFTTPISEIIKCHKYCTGVELRDEDEVKNFLEDCDKLTPAMEEFFNIVYIVDKASGDVYKGFVVSFEDDVIKVYGDFDKAFGRLYLKGYGGFPKTYVVYDNIKDAEDFSKYNQLLDEKTSLLEEISKRQKRLRDVEKMIDNLR